MSNEFEKYYNEDGSVAVLVSNGFGAGWSTWNDDEYRDFLVMSKDLVEMKLKDSSIDDVDSFIKDNFGDKYICTLGWGDCKVIYVERGVQFMISEYDGNESLEIIENIGWMTA